MAHYDFVDTGGNVSVVPLRGDKPEHLGMAGVKYDGGKIRFDLVPPDALAAVAMVLTFGAAKYADRNWEKGIDLARLRAAMMRHLNRIELGEDIDGETGLPHMAHAACCAMMALALWMRQPTPHDSRAKNLNTVTTDKLFSAVGGAIARVRGDVAE
ncbi:dATP/dGTP diphosphohydrolase domain-containing protein [Enterovirga aerilata]|uniref:dATP/dGTP diphosphohydrolase N-terminal domain-containing protein n=1 Tax=Enterovirga aerilata TaxID=2730920 RepID=A0A849IEY2_9HYPH|nr:dATP/dGTP diphosphohydrolase domain-containing protein [Enterovirga sp. DB1703]NNM74785.1 hypothetical protein [Enterovirga sp. DB1703]